jgi:Predicted integral membrane protein
MNNEAHTSSTTRLAAQTSCDLIQDLLPLYIENEVSDNSRQLISAHLASCEQCNSYLAGARSMKAQLQREGQQRREQATQDRLTQEAIALGRRRLALVMLGGLATLAGIALVAFLFLGFGASRTGLLIPPDQMPTLVPPYAGELVPNSEGFVLPSVVPAQGGPAFDPNVPTATPAPFQPNLSSEAPGFEPTASPIPAR